MKYQSNASMLADPDFPAPQGALPVWTKVFTKPGERTFLEITDHPEAKAKSAYFWVFIAGTLSALISSLVQFVATLMGLQQAMPEVGELPGFSGALGAAGLRREASSVDRPVRRQLAVAARPGKRHRFRGGVRAGQSDRRRDPRCGRGNGT